METLIYTLESGKLKVPFAAETISAGFPSPAADYIEDQIDFNELLVKNPFRQGLHERRSPRI